MHECQQINIYQVAGVNIVHYYKNFGAKSVEDKWLYINMII